MLVYILITVMFVKFVTTFHTVCSDFVYLICLRTWVKEIIIIKEIKGKRRNNKINTKILRGLVYELRPQNKALRVIFCFYSLNNFTIQKTSIYEINVVNMYSIQLP